MWNDFEQEELDLLARSTATLASNEEGSMHLSSKYCKSSFIKMGY